MSFSAIPTRYMGVQFRSRLEARWAAFFDLLGWPWDYEPIDLNGYIPDFIVKPPLDRDTLFEVKPITRWPCPVRGCIGCDERERDSREVYDGAVDVVRRSGWSGPALLVGASFVHEAPTRLSHHGAWRIGDTIDISDDARVWSCITSTHRTLARCRRCPRVFVATDVSHLPDDNIFNLQRWCDCDDSDRAAVPFDPTPLWVEAGNRVQWRRP